MPASIPPPRPFKAECETWRVVDKWWTATPEDRTYWELIAGTGERCVVVFDNSTKGFAIVEGGRETSATL